MTTTVPAYTFGGITRPALILDDTGHIILFGAAADFAATYGLKALYAGLPPGTPYPPITDSLSTPTDTNGGANSVAEGAPAGTAVGITASATSPIGSTTYSLVGDTSHGGFTINATTGVVTVADPTKIDFESSPGHAYTVTVQASDGIVTSTQNFNIAVTDVAPSAPTDTNAGANTVTEGARFGHRGRHHRAFDRRQWRRGHLFAHRRHLRRRLQDRRQHRRRHRQRCDQDRLREQRAGSYLYGHRSGQRRHADEFADLHDRRHRRHDCRAHRH